MRAETSFRMATGEHVPFDAAYYNDGITDSFAGNVLCSPTSCLPSHRGPGIHLEFGIDRVDFNTRGRRFIPIFFRIDRPNDDSNASAAHAELSAEAQQFLLSADFSDISRRFQ